MMGGSRWSLLLLLITWMSVSTAQHSKPTGANACIGKQTCHDCIQTPSCAWCSMPNFENKRCFLPYVNKKISAECPPEFTFNPDNVYIKVLTKELWKGNYTIEPGVEERLDIESGGEQSSSGSFHQESSSGSYSGESSSFSSDHKATFDSKLIGGKEEAVQLYPQEINLKLRINEAQKIKIEYAQAEDYPVDLYYLMDLSNSMKDDKQKLSDLGQLLVESMSNITSNFRLGFGSFVDKVAMPYVSMVPKALIEPCDGCAAPYGYRNHMPLSQNSHRFALSLTQGEDIEADTDLEQQSNVSVAATSESLVEPVDKVQVREKDTVKIVDQNKAHSTNTAVASTSQYKTDASIDENLSQTINAHANQCAEKVTPRNSLSVAEKNLAM